MPSTQVNPDQNVTARMLATCEFSMAFDATTLAEAFAIGYRDFGNISSFTPKTDTQKLEYKTSSRGVRRVAATDVLESKLQYQIKCTEWNYQTLQILCGGTATTGHTQASQSAVSGDAFAFNTTAAVIGNWYDLKVSGARIRNVTTLTITSLVEGTDFQVDLKLGRVRFLTAQSASRTPVITATVITVSTAASFLGLLPLNKVRRTGYGRFVVFDQDSTNNIPVDHLDFNCEVTLDSSDEVGGTAYSNITMTITVSDEVGTFLLRFANQTT